MAPILIKVDLPRSLNFMIESWFWRDVESRLFWKGLDLQEKDSAEATDDVLTVCWFCIFFLWLSHQEASSSRPKLCCKRTLLRISGGCDLLESCLYKGSIGWVRTALFDLNIEALGISGIGAFLYPMFWKAPDAILSLHFLMLSSPRANGLLISIDILTCRAPELLIACGLIMLVVDYLAATWRFDFVILRDI